MSEKLTLHWPVPYSAVDREQVLTLRAVFACFQEAAIAHANEFKAGTAAMLSRGEAWVLKRMAAAIDRYPRYEEPLRIETWSSGIRGAKGYREFRVFAGAGEPVFRGSSVWVYVNLRTRSLIRVPADVAEGFLAGPDDVYCANLEDLELLPPDPASAGVFPVSLRYSDIDAMEHVNNTAYFDLIQAALSGLGRPVRPSRVRIRYGKGIPRETRAVEVRLGAADHDGGAAFSIGLGDKVFAQGDVA